MKQTDGLMAEVAKKLSEQGISVEQDAVGGQANGGGEHSKPAASGEQSPKTDIGADKSVAAGADNQRVDLFKVALGALNKVESKSAEKPAEKSAEETDEKRAGDEDAEAGKQRDTAKEREPEPTTKDGRAYAAMRRQIKELTERIERMKEAGNVEELVRKVKRLEDELKRKSEEADKLAEQIGMLDIERDPRFIAKYKQAEESILGQIKDIAKEFEISDEVLEHVLTLPLKKRVEYLTEEASAAAPMLLTLLAQRDALLRQKQSEIINHRQTREQLEKQQSMQILALEKQARERLFDLALEAARKSGHFIFIPSDDDDRNALVEKAVSAARDIFLSSDGVKQTQAMLLGVAAPIYLNLLQNVCKRVVDLERELENRFGKRPTIKASGDSSGKDKLHSKTELTPDEAANILTKRLLE